MKHSLATSVAAVLMLTASGWAARKPHRLTKLEVGVYLASEFDAAATYHVLQDCGSRCYEANPVIRPLAHNPGIFAAMGASALAINYLARKLEDDGHRHWGTALRVFAIGVHAGAGAHALALGH